MKDNKYTFSFNEDKLNKNDPDYHIEYFWYGFKNSMINFYSFINHDYSHILLWSQNLNNFKKDKKYSDIELSIREYISQFSLVLLKHSNTMYHDDIFLTNVNRWNKISSHFNFEKSDKYTKIFLIYCVHLEIKKDIISNKNHRMSPIELYNNLGSIEEIIDKNNFDKFLNYGLINEKIRLLELLSKIPDYDIKLNIKKLYPNFIFDNPTIKLVKISKLFIKFLKNN
jgi:hypothetical protein